MESHKNSDGWRAPGPFSLGEFVVNPATLELTKGGVITRLEPKIMDLLVYFSGRPGRVISKEQIIADVWEGMNVVDEALQRAVSVLRKALNDDLKAPRYLETVSKKGYRLILEPSPLAEAQKMTGKGVGHGRFPWPVFILATIAVGLAAFIVWKEMVPEQVETPAPEAHK